MMAGRFRSGFCSHPDCGGKKETLLVNVGRKLCFKHNNERLNKGKEKKKPFRKLSKKKRKPTGEGAMYKIIWDERPHVCTNCQIYLGDEPCAQFFAHIVRKSKGEQYRLDQNNVRILCLACHMAMDQGTREQFEKRAKVFQS